MELDILQQILTKLTAIEDKVAAIESKVAAIEDRVAAIESDVQDLKKGQAETNKRLNKIERELSDNTAITIALSDQVRFLTEKNKVYDTKFESLKAVL